MASKPWTKAHETRLNELVDLVLAALPVVGKDAVKVAVLKLAGAETIQQLADRIDEERTALSACLSGRALSYAMRRKLDAELKIPPGGMERVLSLLPEGG